MSTQNNFAVKNQKELDLIRISAGLTDRCFELVLKEINSGISEIELATFIFSTLKSLGADGTSFDTIVAFGESGAEPHHIPSARKLKAGDFVTVDFGAILDGYCADFTRTFAYKYANEKLARVYEIVKVSQSLGVDKIADGIKCFDVDRTCRDYINENGYGEYFLHGTGHGVGKEIHEPPILNAKSEETLRNNMVVTVEPGIYLKNLGGVRIEDMVIVGENKPLSCHGRELLILN